MLQLPHLGVASWRAPLTPDGPGAWPLGPAPPLSASCWRMLTMTDLVRFSMRNGGTLLVDLKVMRQLPERPTVLFTGMMMAASLHLQRTFGVHIDQKC